MAMQCVQVIIVTLATEGIGSGLALKCPDSLFAKGYGEVSLTRVADSVVMAVAINTVAGYYITKGLEMIPGFDPFLAGQLSQLASTLLAMGISSVIARVRAGLNEAAMSRAVKAESNGEDIAPEDEARLAKLNPEMYVRLALKVGAVKGGSLLNTAAEMAASRMGTSGLAGLEPENIRDVLQTAPEQFGVHEATVRRNEQVIKEGMVAMAADPDLLTTKMTDIVERNELRDPTGLANDPTRGIDFSIQLKNGLTISWGTLQDMTLGQVLSLVKVGGTLVMGDPGKVASTAGIEVSEPVQQTIQTLVLADPRSPEAATLVDNLKTAILNDCRLFGPIGDAIKAAKPDFFDQANSQVLSDLEYASKEGLVLAATRDALGNVLKPAESMDLESLTMEVASKCEMSGLEIGRLETGRMLLQLVKDGWLVNDEGNIRLNVLDNPTITLMEAGKAQQLEAVASASPNPAVEQAVTAIIDQNPTGIATIKMPDDQLMAMQAASFMFARVEEDAGMLTDASQAAAIQSVEARLQDMFPEKITPEIAEENPAFMRQAGMLFLSSDFIEGEIATEAKVTGAMSRASHGYVDYFATLKSIYEHPATIAKDITGAMLEVKMEYFASWTGNLLGECAAQAAAEPSSSAGYKALLMQVFHDSTTVDNIMAAGTGVQWSVPTPEGKGTDVQLVGTYLNEEGKPQTVCAAFECKAWAYGS